MSRKALSVLNGYATMGELMVGLTKYFAFYNGERPHQSLSDKTPDVVYRTAIGGGAMILDKFGGADGESLVPLGSTRGYLLPNGRSTPESRATVGPKAKPGQRRPAASEVKCTA